MTRNLSVPFQAKVVNEEEWDVCSENSTPLVRNKAFTDIHIPRALWGCARKIDWWLNDERQTGTLFRVLLPAETVKTG